MAARMWPVLCTFFKWGQESTPLVMGSQLMGF